MIRKDIQELRDKRSAHLDTLGLCRAEVGEWATSWRNLKARANRVGRTCDLEFEDYTAMAARAGIKSPVQIGTKPGHYQMGRYGDRGDYVKGNCRFIVKEENLRERWLYAKR
jgi:hypothetical protein